MTRKKILLLFGGESSEHDVSLASARNVAASLDHEKYEVTLGYISRSGAGWRLVRSFDDLNGPILLPILGQQAFQVDSDIHKIDVILPILHGKHGEDGDVQGLASLLHIPCVGPSVLGAALTMDKDITKRLLRDGGIPVVKWQTWPTHNERPRYDDVMRTLGEVLFVKPSSAGSSVGVSKVSRASEFEPALKLAAAHDDFVLIERGITGREIEVAVLGNKLSHVSGPGEILPGEDFYSYDDKYASSSTARAQIPADLPLDTAAAIQDYALRAYQLTRGRGMARVDFFLSGSGEMYLNEINSIPGFTDISMYPKLWRHAGMSQTQLLDELISLATSV